MSKVQYIEHNGERIELTRSQIASELRCDLCGEFLDREEALQLRLEATRIAWTTPINLDVHQSCLKHISEHLAKTVEDRLSGVTEVWP